MIQPLRAQYGAKDNRHELLEWHGLPSTLPPELLGLTDKPPGNHAPGESWWPSLGCGPVGDWWALWWTVPDTTVSRPGMVRSEVAVWRLEEIDTVNDLRPVLASLSGLELIPASSPDLLLAVAEALVSSELRRPPVLSDQDAWPGIIADLWARLWADARRDFSARVAVIPPQGGESVAPPLLYCVPRQRLSGWADFPEIRVCSGRRPLSRAALWLVGEGDATFREIFKVCKYGSGELKKLSAVARAADRLDKLREATSPHKALELLRTLTVLAPNSNEVTNFKEEAMRELNRGFNEVKPDFVFQLKNLAPSSLPIAGLPEAALTMWVRDQAPHLTLNEAQQLFMSLGENKAQVWWQQSVRTALSDGLANLDKQWAKSALNWLGLPDCLETLKAILPSTETVETKLLNVSGEIKPSQTALGQLQEQTVQRQWPRLHAWVLMKVFSPAEAFRLQRQFAGRAFAGLAYLVEHLSGGDVISEVIATPDKQLIQLVAQRTTREPQLLRNLDVGHAAWLELWAAHIRAGGDRWPPGANHAILGLQLLGGIVAGGKEPSGLVASLAEDLADIAFHHPERKKLWSVLSADSCAALLPAVAGVFIQACNAGQVVSSPESQLAQEALRRSRVKGISIKVFAALLSSEPSLDEQDLIRCIVCSTQIDWQPTIAATIGRVVSSRRWKGAAERIYDRFMSGAMPELLPVVEECQSLLSFWSRIRLALKTGNKSHNSSIAEGLVRRVGELGANLAPSGLDYIWERAGGKRKDLPINETQANRWHTAAQLAHQGKLKRGLLALVDELEETNPYNSALKEVAGIITAQRQSEKLNNK